MPCKWRWFSFRKNVLLPLIYCVLDDLSASHRWKLPGSLGRIHFKTRQQGIKEVHFPGSQRNSHRHFVYLPKSTFRRSKEPTKQASRIFRMAFKMDNAKEFVERNTSGQRSWNTPSEHLAHRLAVIHPQIRMRWPKG